MRLTISKALLLASFATPAMADPIADFYKGRTISMTISSAAGGGYDTLARTVARNLPKHLPGSPNIVPRNMPGAGGIVATKHLYTMAPRDGTAIGIVQNNAPLEPLFGTKEADYDPTRFNWIGTPSLETGLLIVWHTSQFRTMEDVTKREMTAGASGVNNASSASPAAALDQNAASIASAVTDWCSSARASASRITHTSARGSAPAGAFFCNALATRGSTVGHVSRGRSASTDAKRWTSSSCHSNPSARGMLCPRNRSASPMFMGAKGMCAKTWVRSPTAQSGVGATV
jgi:hypothetical protein